jgi:hypothetical protein
VRTDFGVILSPRGKCVGEGSDMQPFLVRGGCQLTPATKRLYADSLMFLYYNFNSADFIFLKIQEIGRPLPALL